MTDCFVEWLPLKGSMPKGTWLEPLIFVLLIDDLYTGCMSHTFVDDSTLTEIFERGDPNAMCDPLSWIFPLQVWGTVFPPDLVN